MTYTFQIGDLAAQKYRIQKELDHGLFGHSYLAQTLTTNQLYTLITLPLPAETNVNELTTLSNNFKQLQQVDHPNILKVYALEQDLTTGCHFLVTEYSEGITLHTARMTRKSGMLTMDEALIWCQQIAEAIDFIHQFFSLLHHDIRPQNILITTDGLIKITHFNLLSEPLSKLIRTQYCQDNPTQERNIQNYLAPEQFFDFPLPTPATDRYALAVLFYELTTGQLPFQSKTPQELIHAIYNEIPRANKPFGKRHRQILQRGLHKDPQQRFDSAMDFINALRKPKFSLPSLPLKLISLGKSLLIAAGIAWLVIIMLPPLSAPTSSVSTPPSKLIPPSAVKSIDHTTTSATQKTTPITSEPHEVVTDTLLLIIESRPPGATIFLDDKQLGITPYTVGRIKTGYYSLHLEKEDFIPVTLNLALTEDTVIDMTLDGKVPTMLMAETADHSKEPDNSFEKTTTEPSQSDADQTNHQEQRLKEQSDSKKQSEIEKQAQLEKQAELEKQAQENKKTEQKVALLLHDATRYFKQDQLTKPNNRNALMMYQKILMLVPQHPEATRGIQQIIERLMALGKEDLQNWRLTLPESGNALERFRTILSIQEGHPEAKGGIQEIADRLLSLAERFANDPKTARQYLDQAEAIQPGLPRIAQTRAHLLPTEQPPPKTSQ